VGLGELDTDDGVEHVRSGQSEIASWGSSTLVASEVFDQPPMLVIDAPLFTGDRLDVTGRADAATAVVAGVAELHRRGIVHGDLGRHWITRQADGTVAVRGAGVVALLPPPPADVGRLSPALLAHLAPEQLGGEPADAAGDVFAAALLWAQIVSGSSPFDDPAKLGAFLRYRLTARPTPTATLLGISDAVGAVLDAALSSAPSTRPADATVLLALLPSAQGDGGVPPVRSGAGGVASSP
jgi:serine/threonine-protein kinase